MNPLALLAFVPGGGKTVMIGLAVVAIGVAGLVAYKAVDNALDRLETSAANVATLKQAVEDARAAERAALDFGHRALAQAQQLRVATEAVAQVERGAQQRIGRLDAIFQRHDLGAIAARRPTLVERRINDGSRDALCLLVVLTGGTPDSLACPAGPSRAANGATPPEP